MNAKYLPLVVDLDGTLIKTDMLFESFFYFIRFYPHKVFNLPRWLIQGKQVLKNNLALEVNIPANTLPYNESFLNFLKEEHGKGRTLILATASAEKFAKAVADHLGIFSEVLSTDKTTNLKGKNKLSVLISKFGEKGFDYAGNDNPDLVIFPHANQAILVNASMSVSKQAKKISTVIHEFVDSPIAFKKYIKAIRAYQWLKNLLIFLPLFASHSWGDEKLLLNVILGFVSFSLCASGGYIFNDLLDLTADREHPRKRLRPFASGDLSLLTGSIMMAGLQLVGLGLAFYINILFFLALVLYCIISLAYTFYLKTYVLIDVLILASLYTLRVLAGGILINRELSFWLMAFSIFIFFSLALVKRCSELHLLAKSNKSYAGGRDYSIADADYLREMGIASGYLAVLIVALYIHNPDISELYSRPQILWLIVPVLFYWISRIWLKTGRGEMLDDPIIYSIKDKGSRYVVTAIILIILLAI